MTTPQIATIVLAKQSADDIETLIPALGALHGLTILSDHKAFEFEAEKISRRISAFSLQRDARKRF